MWKPKTLKPWVEKRQQSELAPQWERRLRGERNSHKRMILVPLGIILYTMIDSVFQNIKIFAELALGGGLFLYLFDIYRKRRGEKHLIKTLTKEVAFELFAEEVVLSGNISRFNFLIRNQIGIIAVRRFSLIMIDATLSSGYFINFEHQFNHFLFSIYTRLKNINLEVEQFMKLPDRYKKDNINLLESAKRHNMEAFEDLHFSNMLIALKKKYLKEWLVGGSFFDLDILPGDIEVPEDEEILEFWNGVLEENTGISWRGED